MSGFMEIRFDVSSIDRALGRVEQQVNFASSLALTNTAKDVQKEVRRKLPQKFTIRTGWVARGITVKAATKITQRATVRVKDEFMSLQEFGGTKTSKSGKMVGIPVGARPKHTSVTRPRDYPGSMLKKKGFFLAPLPNKSGGSKNVGVWRRAGGFVTVSKGRYVGRKRQRIELQYALAPSVKIKPRFGFFELSRREASRNIEKRFNEALRFALATAR